MKRIILSSMHSKHQFLSIFILPLLTLSSLSLMSCGDNDELNEIRGKMTFIDNLPDAVDIKSTTAFIPVHDQGLFNIRFSTNDDLVTQFKSMMINTYDPQYSGGFLLQGLLPETTYYYTMECLVGKDSRIPSNQIKTFITHEVSVEFIEPDPEVTNFWDRKLLRVKTYGIEENDVYYHLNVHFCTWDQGEHSRKGWLVSTTYIGDGIWEDGSILFEGDCCQAFVMTFNDGHIVAQTPAMMMTNGALVEIQE